jgi:glycerol uptake facilitator-like aquaporin
MLTEIIGTFMLVLGVMATVKGINPLAGLVP